MFLAVQLFIDALRDAPRNTYKGIECVDILQRKLESRELLYAASKLSSIPTDVVIPPAFFTMKDFSDDELKKVDHLLGLMVGREVVVKLLSFFYCSNINSPSIVSLFRFIPHSEEVSFYCTRPSERTMVAVARCMREEKRTYKLKEIDFTECQLSDAHLLSILPHLVHIEEVTLSCNSDITIKTYKSLVDVVKRTRELKMKKLLVNPVLEDSVKRMFAEYPNITIC